MQDTGRKIDEIVGLLVQVSKEQKRVAKQLNRDVAKKCKAKEADRATIQELQRRITE